MSSYNWNAEDYERNSKAQQQWARELIGKLSLSGSEKILDVGCGDGKVTAEIASFVPNGNVIGVDNSIPMIELANKRYPPKEYSNLSFEVMDAKSLSFSECFDIVFSNAALHWLKDHGPVVKGAYRGLRPGGKILFQMGGKGNAKVILSVLEEIVSLPRWGLYFEDFEFPYGFLGTEQYEELLNDTGFCINRIELISKNMEHDGKEGLKGWIRTTWLPYTERVPSELREEFIEEVAASYLEEVPIKSDGKAYVEMVRLEVEAERLA